MATAVSSYKPPFYVEIEPEALDLRVYRHALDSSDGPIPCWSYVSDGLRRFGQKDIVVTLRRKPDESDDEFPRELVDYFQLMLQQAREGKTVEVGGFSRFARTGGFLGREGPVGFTYTRAASMKGVNFPDRMLAATLVTADEIEAIRAHGSYRLLSLLGFRSNVFPYPAWSERGRKSILKPSDLKASLVGKVPVATARGLMTRRQRNQLHVHIADSRAGDALERRLKQMPTNGPIVLLTDPDPEAKAWLVWKPGMAVETIAIDNRPDATLTGGFFAIFPSSSEEGVHVCEDGFAAMLRPATWNKVRQALVHGESFTVPGHTSSMKLVCGLDDDVPPVRIAGGHFFHADEEMRSRIKADDLAWFDRRVGHIIEDHFADLHPSEGQALSVFCAIKPGQLARFWIEARPEDLAVGSRSLLTRRLSALKPPVVEKPIVWAMRFDLWGGTGDAKHFAHMPGEWTVAFPPHETPSSPDQILERVWPT